MLKNFLLYGERDGKIDLYERSIFFNIIKGYFYKKVLIYWNLVYFKLIFFYDFK